MDVLGETAAPAFTASPPYNSGKSYGKGKFTSKSGYRAKGKGKSKGKERAKENISLSSLRKEKANPKERRVNQNLQKANHSQEEP